MTWNTVLAGCRGATDIEMAEFAAEKSLAFDLKSPTVHVMLANMYPLIFIINDT